ncbi:MAG: hypothetical protein ACE5JA_10975 [bacterium]
MTIVVGIRCTDGVVVASDSQAEFEVGVGVKRLNANKIHCIDNRYAIGGAGVLAHIEAGIENIIFALQAKVEEQRTHLTQDECEDVIWRTLVAMHKRYNIDRSRMLGIEETDYFSPTFLFASKTPEEDPTFFLFTLYSDGLVENIGDYGAVGSGAAYAELLLKNLYSPSADVSAGEKLAAYVISEVKSIDPNCGGDTIIATVSKDSVEQKSEKEVRGLVDEMRTIVSRAYEEVRGSLGDKGG